MMSNYIVNLRVIFQLIFFREHSLLNFQYKSITFSGHVQKVKMQGSVSQIFYLRPSSNSMAKKREDFGYFFTNDFLYLIKFKLRYKYKI